LGGVGQAQELSGVELTPLLMKKYLLTLVVIFVSASLARAAESVPLAGSRPNILFLLTDDQGYGDISAHGNPVLKTPNLDRVRAEGVRFTDFHVSPTCAPTRSALLTGRHEFKNGVTHTILERERMTLTATTLAEMLKSAGYTTGIFGKWHLGDEAEYQPGRRGFDEVFIHGAGGIGQTYPGSCGDAPGNTYFDPAILHNGKFEKTKGYCTDVFFAQATKWIEASKAAGRPFYAHIATNAPHAPYNARPEDAALYRGKVPDEAAANFFGMLHNIDQNLGKLLAKLDELGLTKNTLVVFMNDNGGTAGVKVFNAGMRAQKGTPWLGGTRASSFWRWPGRIAPRDVDALTAHIDFFPTLAEIAGAKLNDKVRDASRRPQPRAVDRARGCAVGGAHAGDARGPLGEGQRSGAGEVPQHVGARAAVALGLGGGWRGARVAVIRCEGRSGRADRRRGAASGRCAAHGGQLRPLVERRAADARERESAVSALQPV
jgi:arylsulfatase A-like enzyme